MGLPDDEKGSTKRSVLQGKEKDWNGAASATLFLFQSHAARLSFYGKQVNTARMKIGICRAVWTVVRGADAVRAKGSPV